MQGQQHDWLPDEELCVMLIEVLCRSPQRLDRALKLVRDDMPVRPPGFLLYVCIWTWALLMRAT